MSQATSLPGQMSGSEQDTRDNHIGASSSKEVRAGVAEAGTLIKQAVTTAVSTARDQLNRAAESIEDQTQSVEEWLRDFVEEKPVTALLSAMGIGVLAGFLLWSR